jgi:hypothetical protein
MDPHRATPPDDHAVPPGAGYAPNWDWQREFEESARRPGMPDVTPVLALLDALRRLIPPELQEQFMALQREVLLMLRALIDWYLERLDRRWRQAPVEDIPID